MIMSLLSGALATALFIATLNIGEPTDKDSQINL